MAQPLDKISVFNTGPSKNDLAIERLEKDMARLSGQMHLVSLQHNAIKQDQAKISRDFDAFEAHTKADKEAQDEFDETLMSRLAKTDNLVKQQMAQENSLFYRVTQMEKMLVGVVLKRDLELQMQEMDDNYSQCKTIVKEVGGQNAEIKRDIADLDARIVNIYEMLQDLKHDMAVTTVKTPFLYTPYHQQDCGQFPSE